VFDIEQGDGGLANLFSRAFQSTFLLILFHGMIGSVFFGVSFSLTHFLPACRSFNMTVLVTVSHSAPYGFPDAASLMRGFFSDSNIDYLSPQLYTSGNEGQNDYTTSQGVGWNEYARSRAQVNISLFLPLPSFFYSLI
jgi:hypothetical protein